LEFCQEAVANWKHLKPAILDGDQYRLVSPYETYHAAVQYVDKSKNMAVLFAYDLAPRYKANLSAVKLQGLDPNKMYLVKEINLMPGTEAKLKQDGKIFSGDYLMKIGLEAFTYLHNTSTVVELTAQ
jgi:alpha-galactosidase